MTAKGKLGELGATLTDDVDVREEDNQVWVKPRNDSMRARKMWGTARSVVQNLVTGVSEGFTKTLEISGVGYRAQVQGKDLVLQLGFSHDVKYPIPQGDRYSVSGTDAHRDQRCGQAEGRPGGR